MSNIALQVQLTASGSVLASGNILFDNILYSRGNITYHTATGVLTFNESGRYLVNWWLATQNSTAPDGLCFSLHTSEGDDIIGSSSVNTGEISGIGILEVEAGTSVVLVNKTGYAVTYAANPVAGSMMVVEG